MYDLCREFFNDFPFHSCQYHWQNEGKKKKFEFQWSLCYAASFRLCNPFLRHALHCIALLGKVTTLILSFKSSDESFQTKLLCWNHVRGLFFISRPSCLELHYSCYFLSFCGFCSIKNLLVSRFPVIFSMVFFKQVLNEEFQIHVICNTKVYEWFIVIV